MRKPASGSSDVHVTHLPGLGDRHDFTTPGGERIGVVRHDDGTRELIVFSRRDPDACVASLRLSGADARRVAALLGQDLEPGS